VLGWYGSTSEYGNRDFRLRYSDLIEEQQAEFIRKLNEVALRNGPVCAQSDVARRKGYAPSYNCRNVWPSMKTRFRVLYIALKTRNSTRHVNDA
jgi:hypothetical protein